MATYVLIHGAGSTSWYWHLVVPRLRARGHDVLAPDLPCDDDTAGLTEYTDVVLDAIGERRNLVVVAQSMAGFTAPLVADRVPVDLIVLVAAMVPLPHELLGDWWTHTAYEAAKREQDERDGRTQDGFDPLATFLHDLPREVVVESVKHARDQSATPFGERWPLDAWPDVPTRFLLCRDDRFFPADFLRRVVRERLGFPPDEMDAGHLPALGHPDELVERLEAYRLEAAGGPYESTGLSTGRE